MKKLIIIIIVALAPVILPAQSTPLSSLYDRYVSEPGFETTEIMPGSMSFDWEKTMDNAQVKEIMQHIDKIRILRYSAEGAVQDQDKIWKKMQKTADNELYTEVITVNAENIYARMFMIKGQAGNTKEVAMLAKSTEGIMLLTITGDMDFSAMFSPDHMKSLREMGEYYLQNKGECQPEGQ